MTEKLRLEKLAEYAFLGFVVISIIAGLAVGYMALPESGVASGDVANTVAYVTLIMVILGIIVGFVSISEKETGTFLIAAIALAVIRGEIFRALDKIHVLLANWAIYIVNFMVAFVAPAAVIIAIKQVYVLARKK
jgi:lysylphosphatidylglycerol synthetase-like protein (DUF2156 family)